MRADNGKTFYFDPGHNDRGDFVRISEVNSAQQRCQMVDNPILQVKMVSGMRNSLTVSMRNLPHFRDLLTEICDKMDELKKGDHAEADDAPKEKAESKA